MSFTGAVFLACAALALGCVIVALIAVGGAGSPASVRFDELEDRLREPDDEPVR